MPLTHVREKVGQDNPRHSREVVEITGDRHHRGCHDSRIEAREEKTYQDTIHPTVNHWTRRQVQEELGSATMR